MPAPQQAETGSVPARKRNGRARKPKSVPHPTPAERAARGKAARAAAPRAEQGEWAPASDRSDPVDLLEEQAASRVQELVPIRYGRMLVSPFTFYRGAAYLMAADLASAPRTGLEVQLCGDAHLSNFGGFAAPDRRLSSASTTSTRRCPGRSSGTSSGSSPASPWPAAIAASTPKQRRAINRAVVRAYREGDQSFAAMRNLDLWYSRIDVDELARARGAARELEGAEAVRANVAKARVEGQHEGLREADDDGRRRAQDRQRPAADRADRGHCVRRRAGRDRRRSCTT